MRGEQSIGGMLVHHGMSIFYSCKESLECSSEALLTDEYYHYS